MELQALYQVYLSHPRITTDSRKIEHGCFFFALKGENFNGNTFASEAIEKGAAYALVDEPAFAVNERIILVDNVLKSLQDLARHHRQKLGIPILAITGTNGKTTTKELVAKVLSEKFNLVYTKGNLNNHIGVPLTLLTLKPDTRLGVIEMGANHPGEIDELCRIALPDFGLITNVGRAHLEGFGSFEGVIQTKTELYRFLEGNNGTIFINKSNPSLTPHTGRTKQVGYSTVTVPECLEGEIVNSDPFLVLKLLFPRGWLYVKTKLVGKYNFENVMAAATIGLYFGIDPTKIATAIESYQPDNNRSQLVNTGKNNLLLDAYNANPSSMRAALENFDQMASQRKGVILGDMLELGDVSTEEHQKIVNFVKTMKLELVLLVGPRFAGCTLPSSFRHFGHLEKLQEFLREMKLTGYLLLIKGSRGMKLEIITKDL
jgi:UDP-N-acetylmuramoyl-tripeptide--D-alanyl-D-alanine ligase